MQTVSAEPVHMNDKNQLEIIIIRVRKPSPIKAVAEAYLRAFSYSERYESLNSSIRMIWSGIIPAFVCSLDSYRVESRIGSVRDS